LAAIQGFVLVKGEGVRGGESGTPWLQSGDALGDVRATTAIGAPTQLATGEPLLLLVFHPECGHCQDVVPLWRDWIQGSEPGVRIATVTLASPEEGAAFLASFDWQPEVWTVEPEAGAAGRRPLSTRTPWLFLLDGNGVVLAEVHGRLIAELAADWPLIMHIRAVQP